MIRKMLPFGIALVLCTVGLVAAQAQAPTNDTPPGDETTGTPDSGPGTDNSTANGTHDDVGDQLEQQFSGDGIDDANDTIEGNGTHDQVGDQLEEQFSAEATTDAADTADLEHQADNETITDSNETAPLHEDDGQDLNVEDGSVDNTGAEGVNELDEQDMAREP